MSRSCTPQSTASETSTLLSSRKPPAVRQYGGRVLAIIIGIYIWRMALAVLGNIASVSISQIREGVICRNFYDNVSDPPNDPRCKNSDVQAEFALVEGIELVFQLLPGIITAPFYGRLSDKYGRRPALFLTALGTLLTNAAQLAVCMSNPPSRLRMDANHAMNRCISTYISSEIRMGSRTSGIYWWWRPFKYCLANGHDQ